MFGYIKPLEDELKVREYKLYKSVYCGLCKTSKKRISRFSRFFLSYDYTFFALVHMIFTGNPYSICKARCGFHLFAKTDCIKENDSLALSASIFSILNYYKLCDTISDERFFSSLFARLLLPIAKRMKNKAVKAGYAEADFIISDCLAEISALEKSNSTCIDEISAVFGKMMGHLMKLELPEKQKDDAYSVGFEVGKFIYCADALEDLYKDEKNNAFNPYLTEYKNAKDAENILCKNKNVIFHGTDRAADILSAKKASLSVEGKALCSVAQNVLYLGCPAIIERIFSKNKNN